MRTQKWGDKQTEESRALDRLIVELHDAGRPFLTIGEEFGRSPQWAPSRYRRELRRRAEFKRKVAK